jgi:LysM repeat protein
MRSVHSLSQGLLVSLVVAATVFGAFSLSLHRSSPSNRLAELPMPTVTLDLTDPSPTPTPSATRQLPASATLAISPTPSVTPSPTPTACPVPADWQPVIVGPFDTLALLAQRFNLSPDQLARANCLTQRVVTVGQAIFVPAFRPTPTQVPCYPPGNWARYIVQPGDTLSAIAQRYNLSLYTLMRANCLTTAYIYAGQYLFVPWISPIVIFTPTPMIPTATPTPIVTLSPTETATPPSEITPTDTPLPTITATVEPGETPTETPVWTPTATPLPTDTPAPVPTDTAMPVPTDTPAPPPSTPIPTEPPLNTPEPTAATTP